MTADKNAILLIDDDADLGTLMRELFGQHGFEGTGVPLLVFPGLVDLGRVDPGRVDPGLRDVVPAVGTGSAR
jgi:hypothetical protein